MPVPCLSCFPSSLALFLSSYMRRTGRKFATCTISLSFSSTKASRLGRTIAIRWLSLVSSSPPPVFVAELQFNSDDEPPCPYTGEVTVVSPDGDVLKTTLALGEVKSLSLSRLRGTSSQVEKKSSF